MLRPLNNDVSDLLPRAISATARYCSLHQSAYTMSSISYIHEPGAGQRYSDLGHYSQAVVIGNIAKLLGQAGWDDDSNFDQ